MTVRAASGRYGGTTGNATLFQEAIDEYWDVSAYRAVQRQEARERAVLEVIAEDAAEWHPGINKEEGWAITAHPSLVATITGLSDLHR